MAIEVYVMSQKVTVNGITVAFPDGSIKELSIDHARELFNQLNDLFGSKVTIMQNYPVVIEREVWPRWGQPTFISSPDTPTMPECPQIWCSSSSSM